MQICCCKSCLTFHLLIQPTRSLKDRVQRVQADFSQDSRQSLQGQLGHQAVDYLGGREGDMVGLNPVTVDLQG